MRTPSTTTYSITVIALGVFGWTTQAALAWTITTPQQRTSLLRLQRPATSPAHRLATTTQLSFFSKETTADQVKAETDDDSSSSNDWLATLQSSFVPAQSSSTTTTPKTTTTTTSDDDSTSNGLLQVLQTTAAPAVATAQSVLDETTGGWALSFANLHPEKPNTTTGMAFLATNLFYLTAGLWLQFVTGDVVLGVATDLCAAASFAYHYQQLLAADQTGITKQGREAVRLALLMDYIFAVTAIGLASADLLQLPFLSVPWTDVGTAVAVATAGLGCLGLSWKYEQDDGNAYIWWHGLWHLGSAYTGFLVGNLHQQAVMAAAAAAAASGAAGASLM